MRISREIKLLLIGFLGIINVLCLVPASAATANISHAYHTNGSVDTGAIMTLNASNTDTVEVASSGNDQRLIGVTVAKNDSLLAVDESDSTVQVATSGNAKTLVSTINGDIAVGNQIAASPLKGVGMKASPGMRVIGLAQSAFNSKSSGASQKQVTNKSGKATDVAVGYANIVISVGTSTSNGSGASQSALQRLGRSITGHTVSTVRVLVSLIVAIVAIVSVVTLIYSSIYGSLISVGRNPLARYAIYRTLGTVMVMIGVTALIACTTIYFLLL